MTPFAPPPCSPRAVVAGASPRPVEPPFRRFLRLALARAAPWLCSLGLAAEPALAGAISGTVLGVGGVPLRGFSLTAYSANVPSAPSGTTSGFDGGYLITGLSPGTYFVQALPPFPNPEGYTGATYAGIASNNFCGARGTEVAVGFGTTSDIDFHLAVGETIRGTIVEAETGAPSVGSGVVAYDHRGCDLGGVGVDATGGYELTGLPPGGYYLVASSSNGERAAQLHPSVPCANRQCDLFLGTLVPTGSTADFALPAGSSIAGTITHGSGSALALAQVELWRGSERVSTVVTNGLGAYIFVGLSPGIGYRVLANPPTGLVAEVYPDAPCPGGSCDVGSTGSGIDIPTPGVTVIGRDIRLAAGHFISGTLTPAVPVTVEVFGSTGLAGAVFANGSYLVPDLPNGTYVVRATAGDRLTELWDNRACPANQLCLGDPVTISGANRTGINFTLALARKVRGTVRSETGDPIGGAVVEVVAADGSLMSSGTTVLDGTYATSSEGLPPGTYFVRTRLPRRLHPFADRLWNDRPCGASCFPAAGDPVTVTASADTTGIDFVLPFSGLDYYTLPPCRVFDSRGGPTITSGVLQSLTLEAVCGVPGNAVAVSANVTVISPSAAGNLALWPWNLPSQPPTSTVNFTAGLSRANNTLLALSLEGALNVAVRGVLPPAGRYHLVIDVSGYFTAAAPP